MSDLKYVGLAMLVVLLVLTYFMGSFNGAVMLSLAVFFIWFMPGYVLIHFFVKDINCVEKVILGFFIGFGLNALILYYLNLLGFMVVSSFFAYLIGIMAVCVLILEKVFKRKAV